MRTTPLLAGVALVLVAAGATMAASPPPSAAPIAKPSPSQTTSPKTGTGSSGASSSGALSAGIQPIDVTTGNVTVVTAPNGTGTITVTLKGLRPDARWTVDIDGGTLAKTLENRADEIAFRSGMTVERLSSDTVRIHLTTPEMKAFEAARSSSGIVVLVSDGANRAAAVFAPA